MRSRRNALFSSFIVLLLVGCSRGGPVVDPAEVFARYDWWDSEDWRWYEERIPFIDTPDKQINEVYYYRWEVLKTHLTYGSPETGYTFTEFMDRPFWSGAYGGISCPLGHQLSEVRWLKDARIIDDFARYWIDTEDARPRSYSNWYSSGLWQIHEVWGDSSWIASMLPYMEEQTAGWVDEHFDAEHGMFFRTGHDDGMEVNINSRQAEDNWVVEGYRPTLNSYLYGDLLALSRVARLTGEAANAARYAQRAETLKQRVLDELWDPERQFFFHQWAQDHPPGIKAKTLTHETGPYAGSEHGRELIGYVPWQFNLPDEEHSMAWQFLMDPDYFNAEYGPTVTEQGDPLFHVSPNCCVWSGQSWPYATTQTLVAMANLLNNYDQDVVDQEDYFELLKTYTKTQYKDGRPYIAESANPFDGSWFGSNLPNHSEHYLHSGYVDLVLSGLLGIRPQEGNVIEISPLVPEDWDWFAVEGLQVHGHDMTIIWDRDGSRYGRGPGLQVFLDNRKVFQSSELEDVRLEVPSRGALEFERPHNLAVNNGTRFPEVSASHSSPEHPPFYAIDGGIWYHDVPVNRWTAEGTSNEEDWIMVDFGAAQTVSEIKLYFIDDGARVVPPASFRVESWIDGAWRAADVQSIYPGEPTGRRANIVRVSPHETEKVRVIFEHAEGSVTGLSEFEVWAPSEVEVQAPRRDPANKALNPDGADFPHFTASFANNPDGLAVLGDGSFGLTTYQANRWTSVDSPNEADWVEIDFGKAQSISRADVYLWGDSPRYLARVDSSVSSPRSLRVEVLVGDGWRAVENPEYFPLSPQTMARNSISFDAVETSSMRILFEHNLPSFSGATEIQVW